MQTYQMAMLLLFENIDVMTCKEIQVGCVIDISGCGMKLNQIKY